MKATTVQNLKLVLLMTFVLTIITSHQQRTMGDDLDPTNLMLHDSIFIDGNDDFRTKAAEEGWQGSGSKDKPYQIENYYFDGNNQLDEYGYILTWDLINHIEISNSNLYVIIQNNYFEDGIEGIVIINSANIIIKGNIITGMSNGISIINSHNIRVLENVFSQIYLITTSIYVWEIPYHREILYRSALNIESSYQVYVIENNFNNIEPNDMMLSMDWSNRIRITYPYAIDSDHSNSSYLFIWNNSFTNVYHCIVGNYQYSQIISNQFSNIGSGIRFYESSNNLIMDNDFNNIHEPFGLNTDQYSLSTAISFPRDTMAGPMKEGSSNNSIIGNYIENAERGIYINQFKGSNTTIMGNEIQNTTTSGIFLGYRGSDWPSYNFNETPLLPDMITDNILSNGYLGIHVSADEEVEGAAKYFLRGNIKQNNFIDNDNQILFTEYDYDISSGQEEEYTGAIAADQINYNHWSDYTSPDTDGDDIVDNPYPISTGSDNSPKVTPFNIDREAINELYYPDDYKASKDVSSSDEPLEEQLIISNTKLAAAGIGVLTFIGGGSYYYYQKVPRSSLKISSQKGVDGIISSIFSSKSAGFLVLGSKIVNHDDLSDELKKAIPDKLLEYKFLMNPVRLSICKLLIDSVDLPSKNIKEALDVSWDNFGTHSKALRDEGLVETYSKFVDGIESQIIRITPEGEKSYNELIGILQELFDNNYLYSTYLDTITKMPDTYDQPMQ
ncbi:MAG: hypothetical protein GPJ54_21745 [Candidatus Heimdallarchaeota archaeon]|nr:hypothetical protein [Candidatus Heimdallarchaeota archaeon]